MTTSRISWISWPKVFWKQAEDGGRQATHERIASQALLSSRALEVLGAMAEALFEEGETGLLEEHKAWLLHDLNDLFASSTGVSRLAMHAIPWIMEWSPLVTLREFRLLTSLTKEERLKWLEAIETTPIGPLNLIYFLTKTLLCTIYFEHPEMLATLGFDAKCKTGTRPEKPLEKTS